MDARFRKLTHWLLDPGSGWYLYDAAAISDTNWVSGVGYFDPGGGQVAYDRLFLLDISSAVPEPAGLSILALAVPALLRRRKRVTMHLWLKKNSR